MILSNYEKIEKCILIENQYYFEIFPPKKPFYNFQSISEYRNKAINDRKILMLDKLDQFINMSKSISLQSLWYEFVCGSYCDSTKLLFEWVKVLSSKPENIEEHFKSIYAERSAYLKNAHHRDSINMPGVRVSYIPIQRMVIYELDKIDNW